MPIIATPSRRRIAMAVLLALAAAGAVIRHFAPAGSTLHDLGTLLLVMWLPAVGNLVAYVVHKIPRRARAAPPPPAFAGGDVFSAQLEVQLEANEPRVQLAAPEDTRCTLIVANQGFTARLAQPLAEVLALPGRPCVPLELLRPEVALARLPQGTAFHLLVGSTPVARGTVLAKA